VTGLALYGLAIGCVDVIGIEAMVQAHRPLELGQPCAACVEASCRDAERSCAADPLCAELAACTARYKNDPAARAQCRLAHPEAAALSSWRDVDGCLRVDCQDDCTGVAGLFRAYGPACDECVLAACPEQLAACVADGACERMVLEAFDDEPMTPPKIVSLWTEVADAAATCTAGPCGVECGRTDENYACVDGYDWPQPEPGVDETELLVETRLTDGITTPVFGGVHIESCSPLSLPCDVLSRGVSDEDGRLTLLVPVAISTGFRGYFQAYTAPPAEEVMRERIFSGHPLYGPSRGQVLVLTPGTFDTTMALAGTRRVDGRAQVVAVFLDCAGNTSPGVTLEHPAEILVDASSRVYYPIQGSAPTEDNGWALLLNVAPGCIEVTGRRGGGETHRGRFSATPDVLTVAFLWPRSRAADVGHVCTPSFPVP
jgi:hypothetical protein